MDELLQPSTDLGVLVQVIVLAVAFVLGLWLTRQRSEWRLVVLGVGLVVAGLMGLRAAH